MNIPPTFLAAIFLACFVSALPAKADLIAISPGIKNPANGNTYFLLENSGWTAAEAKAQAMGGHLVTVRNQLEQEWVVATFSKYDGEDRFLWIGLNDVAEEGTWVWSSGEPVTYTHWWTGEPNSLTSEEDYVQIIASNNNQQIPVGYWNDIINSAWPYQGAASGHNFGPVYGVAEIVAVPESGGIVLVFASMVGVMIGVKHLRKMRRAAG